MCKQTEFLLTEVEASEEWRGIVHHAPSGGIAEARVCV